MSETDKELAQGWFRKAENDLLSARNNLAAKIVPTDAVCFHCQQAAEKFLKGFLAWHGKPFGKTHDLESLVTVCAQVIPDLLDLRNDANMLTDFAVEVRYPDVPEEPTLPEAKEALRRAKNIRKKALSALGIGKRRK
jgi:HEPN domain-containing protein